ncbi:uncharacterized protein CEXT_614831 [Caerostris extrusa]|uniref:Uncharacterized protein n=1 Tax=Caerostris extrusa TaxID=172846 RepID=A0AAV4WAP7_CAEEX|nr:uncharacterized protein CEXT_614831 [Caerostris extrusa]
MAIPGVTGVVMPLFMALQDRLTTLIPNMPNILRPGNTGNNQQGGGGNNLMANLLNIFGGRPSNQNQQGSATGSGSAEATNETPTIFRFKRTSSSCPPPPRRSTRDSEKCSTSCTRRTTSSTTSPAHSRTAECK